MANFFFGKNSEIVSTDHPMLNGDNSFCQCFRFYSFFLTILTASSEQFQYFDRQCLQYISNFDVFLISKHLFNNIWMVIFFFLYAYSILIKQIRNDYKNWKITILSTCIDWRQKFIKPSNKMNDWVLLRKMCTL